MPTTGTNNHAACGAQGRLHRVLFNFHQGARDTITSVLEIICGYFITVAVRCE